MLKLDHIKLSEEALKYKHCLGEMDDLKSIVQVSCKRTNTTRPYNLISCTADFVLISCPFVKMLIVTQQVSDHDELKRKISEGEKQRKELYNKVLELKGLTCFKFKQDPALESFPGLRVRMRSAIYNGVGERCTWD